MTSTGAIMGTPHYMSPEQAKGQRADIRSDIYSLWVVLYQMLTGQLPFDADTPWEVIRQHVEIQAGPVRQVRPEVPPSLELVVARCLQKDPVDRYQTPHEVARALAQVLSELTRARRQPQGRQTRREEPVLRSVAASSAHRSSVSSSSQMPQPRSDKPRTRRLVYGTAIAVLTVSLALAALFGFGNNDGEPADPPRPPVVGQPTGSAPVAVAITQTPTQTPVPTRTQQPQPTPSPTAVTTPTPTHTSVPTATRPPQPSATAQIVPGPATGFGPTRTPLPKGSPAPTRTPTVTPTPTRTPTIVRVSADGETGPPIRRSRVDNFPPSTGGLRLVLPTKP